MDLKDRLIIGSIFIGSLVFQTLPVWGAEMDAGQDRPERNYSATELPPINLDYYQIATQTRGDFYFWAPNEFSSPEAQQFMAKAFIQTGKFLLLYDYGELTAKENKRTLFFEVKPEFTEIMIFTGIQSKDSIEIIPPGGEPIKEMTDKIKTYEFTHMKMAVIKQPAEGKWQINLTGKGKFLVSVRE